MAGEVEGVMVNGRSLTDYVKGLTGGKNAPAVAQYINNITTATGAPILTRKNFMQILESWEAALPLQSLWMVFFRVPAIVQDEVMNSWGEHIVKFPKKEGGVTVAQRLLNKDKFQTTMGCAFAQTVSLPPEQVTIDQVGIPNSRGFLPGPVINQRQKFASVNIEFLETNLSFVDFLIRPWTVLGSHFGAVARDPSVKITADIMLVNFSRAGTDFNYKPVHTNGGYTDYVPLNERGFVPRKIWMFSDCMPITIAQERYSHTTDASPDRRDTEWIFRRYQVLLPSQFESMFTAIDGENNPEARTQGAATEMYPYGETQTTPGFYDVSGAVYPDFPTLPRNQKKFWYGNMAYSGGHTSVGGAIGSGAWMRQYISSKYPAPPNQPGLAPGKKYGATLKKMLKYKGSPGSRTDILSILGF